ncbi:MULTISPECIES: L-threonylcarbamoyladenylate synthase [Asticcacaulis]|uniref:L-threonylcarbamoyladenylate synthase n=1 Tax=Asticcacaulis TaxID=76890 RepID=UPI001AE4D722|nr:L-threonylcarbamoyladenylate synthase [Asticcacaulis sp. BE141]MBP2158843.1 L-threonylcarbamoyladenylate synthase [Asticcacaulis solisilvae]MDR6799889.1 L-threonylcarbamoyladenylate synthase [Asticcacaulis sp. BE141]
MSIVAAVQALTNGDLIHLPTETVYGLGARADDADAVVKVFEAKGRPRFNPLIVHVGSVALARRIGVFDDRAEALAAKFWPGPLTLVLPVRDFDAACDLARAGLDSVAIRMPDHPMALEILNSVDFGVVAPSANRSGRPSPTTQADAFDETGAFVAASPDGGDCGIGVESSVVSLLKDARYLRAGAVTRADIEAVIGPLAADASEGHRSPGRLSLHYAPDAPVRINVATPSPGAAYLAFGPVEHDGPVVQLSADRNLSEAAARLFRALREADRLNPPVIEIAPIPEDGIGEAINDRIRRAAGFVG